PDGCDAVVSADDWIRVTKGEKRCGNECDGKRCERDTESVDFSGGGGGLERVSGFENEKKGEEQNRMRGEDKRNDSSAHECLSVDACTSGAKAPTSLRLFGAGEPAPYKANQRQKRRQDALRHCSGQAGATNNVKTCLLLEVQLVRCLVRPEA